MIVLQLMNRIRGKTVHLFATPETNLRNEAYLSTRQSLLFTDINNVNVYDETLAEERLTFYFR